MTVTVFGCSPKKEESEVPQKDEEPVIAVEGIRIVRQRLIESIEGSGLISGINEAYVIAENRGIIQSVNFELGDFVNTGKTLVRIDPKLPKLNMEQAEHQWNTAAFDLSAIQKLYKTGNETLSRLNQYKSAEIAARVQYEQAVKAYQDCFIKAPISGFIAEKGNEITRGNYLNNNSRVARIVDLSSLRMEVAFGEGQIGYIREGAAAQIRVAAVCDDKPFSGKVTAIAAGSDQQTGSFMVVITWINTCESGELKSGMTGTVTVAIDSLPESIIVPNYTIREAETGGFVFVAENGVAKQRKIKTGKRLGQRVEVLSGLKEGEILITSGFFQFSDGNNVTVKLTE